MGNSDLEKLKVQLPFVFTEREFKHAVTELSEKMAFGDARKKKLLKSTRNFQLKVLWNKAREVKFLSFSPNEVTIMDLLSSTHPRHYFSHHSALYFNELTDQRPEEYILTREKIGQSSAHTKTIEDIRIRQSFLKGHRRSTNFFTYNSCKITLVDKHDLNRIGVITKSLFNSGKAKEVDVFYTDVERTFIDCIIGPQYAGGIKTVLLSFVDSDIDLEKLFDVYKVYSPIYPYWQSVGLVLEFCLGSKVSDAWQSFFDIPKREFFLDRNFRDDWEFNRKWKVYYPKGLGL